MCSWKNGSLPDFSLAESTSEASCCMCEINECMQVTGSLPCIPYASAAVIFKVICALSHALHIISVAMICQPYVYAMHHAYVCTALAIYCCVHKYMKKGGNWFCLFNRSHKEKRAQTLLNTCRYLLKKFVPTPG